MKQAQRLLADASVLHRKGHVEDALRMYERVLALQPRNGSARLYMAIIQCQKGLVHDALRNARQAMDDAEKPDVNMYSNYGVLLKNVGQYGEALLAYKQALLLEPQNLGVKANLGTLYMILGQLDEAEPMLRDLTVATEEPAPWLNLARIAFMRNDLDLVEECLQHAEDLDSTHQDIFVIRAAKALRERDHAAAWAALKKVFPLAPAHAESWQNVQTLDQDVLELPYLEAALGAVAKAGTQSASTLASCVDLCRKNLIWGPLPNLERQLTAMLQKPFDKTPSDGATFTLLAANVPQEGHLRSARASWTANTGTANTGGQHSQAHSFAAVPPKDALRVGFVSSDFRSHAVGINVVGVMEKLPKGRVTWYAYSNSFDDEKGERHRFRHAFDRFINVAKLSDADLAARIRQDEIDVLIDLNGITADTRIRVMAHRAAPVQATWFGMAGSPGSLGAVDYYLGDNVCATAQNADGFDECLLLLPRCYQPADHVQPDLSLAGSRADHDLPQDAVVLCSFNQHYKLSPDTFGLWVRLLRAAPHTVLWMLQPKSEPIAHRLRQLFVDAGIDPERIIYAKGMPQAQHRARTAHADIFLDSWPYNAHTTAADALSVGVPVLTLPGNNYVSRVAASVLTSSQLPQWIASTAEDYYAKALAFANLDRASMDAEKARVREIYWASPMVDTQAFGAYLESMCLGLYARAAAGLPPTSLQLHEDGTLEPLAFGRQAGDNAPSPQDQPCNTPKAQTQTKTQTAGPEDHQEQSQDPEQHQKSQPDDAEAPLPLQKGKSTARLHNLGILQTQVLHMAAAPQIIDVGATPADGGVQVFEALADAGLVEILGFEPNTEGFDLLTKAARPHRHYVCCALGDGKEATYHQCRAPGMNSLLLPDQSWLSLFPRFADWGQVLDRQPLATTRLDDVPQAAQTRYIKLDIQGAELSVLQHATQTLQYVALLHLEASPTPCYRGEASFFEVGLWLKQQGFVLHHLAKIDRRTFLPFGDEQRPNSGINHIYQVDAVFIPDPRNFAFMEQDRLLALAFLAHALYRSFDLSTLALRQLDQRDNGQREDAYRRYLEQAKLDA